MVLFNFIFTTLWVLMTILVMLIATGVAMFGLEPVALIVLVPFGTLAILTFWIKEI